MPSYADGDAGFFLTQGERDDVEQSGLVAPVHKVQRHILDQKPWLCRPRVKWRVEQQMI
jgi:hypothetical protein